MVVQGKLISSRVWVLFVLALTISVAVTLAVVQATQAAPPDSSAITQVEPATGEVESFALAGAQWCQCVKYIQNRYNLRGSDHAKNMGSVLINNGFRKVSDPRVGAVVIFQPGFFSSGDAAVYGHIGVITGFQSVNSNRSWSLTVRGANEIWTTFTEYNCTNVSQGGYKSFPKGSSLVSYYVR